MLSRTESENIKNKPLLTPAHKKLIYQFLEMSACTALEFGVAREMIAATNPYISPDTPLTSNPYFAFALVEGINFISRLVQLGVVWIVDIDEEDDENLEEANCSNYAFPQRTEEAIGFVFEILRAVGLAVVTTGSFMMLAHEEGHAWMANKYFVNAQPSIILFPFKCGETKYSMKVLSPAGEAIGLERAKLAISAAGAGSEILLDSLFLIVAQIISEFNADIQKFFRVTAYSDFLTIIGYAFSAYNSDTCKNDPAHDFCRLKEGGYSPAQIVFATLGYLLFLQTVLSALGYGVYRLRKHCHKPKNQIIDVTDDLEAQTLPKISDKPRLQFINSLQPSANKMLTESLLDVEEKDKYIVKPMI